MRTPDVVIVGAQKAATTGLLHTLGQHPAVITPRVHEATTLHLGPADWPGWLRSYEPELERVDKDQVVLVKLATAMHFRDTLETIKALNADARVVGVLRHPVDRMLSLHRYATQQGLESRAPEEALRDDRVQRAAHWRLNTYSSGSRYASAISTIQEVFGPDQVVFVDYADASRPANLLALQGFLGLDPVLLRPVRANESREPRSGGVARATNAGLLRALGRLTVPARWRDGVRSSLQTWNASSAPPRQAVISTDFRTKLLERHSPDVDAAEDVLARSLPAWRM